jgi:hypothetical protein
MERKSFFWKNSTPPYLFKTRQGKRRMKYENCFTPGFHACRAPERLEGDRPQIS